MDTFEDLFQDDEVRITLIIKKFFNSRFRYSLEATLLSSLEIQ